MLNQVHLAQIYRSVAVLLAAVVAGFIAGGPLAAQETIDVQPAEVRLVGNFSLSQLLVRTANADAARADDLTSQATFATSDAAVVTVTNRGRLLAVGNGQATVQVAVGGVSRAIPVTVEGVEAAPKVDYSRQIGPIISKAGCNAGSCHASQHGKGGFVLSVVGFDPTKDREAIVRDRIGRRVDFLQPERSLLLLKPTMQVPHGGGLRLTKDSVDYATLLAWIKAGAPGPVANSPEVTSLTISPLNRIARPGSKQQLRVEAAYSDGTTRDVTAWAKYDSLDEGLLAVDRHGEVTVAGQGQAAIMVRFEGQTGVALFSSPYSESAALAGWQDINFIDTHAAAKFRELGIEPSPPCDDATFLRRVFLDCIGSLPTIDETREFLASTDPNKRQQWIDRLLGRTGDPKLDIYNDRYAAFWTLKWSDLIRNSSDNLGDQGMWSLHNWIRDSFRVNKPFDQFVRELVTAKGSIYMNGPANYFRVNNNAMDLTEATSQLFLGVRLECAKCHHHPFEAYSQADYYSFAAFFSRVGLKSSEEFGLFGSEQVVVVRSAGEISHPKTGQRLPPTTLSGQPLDHPLDRRIPLAQWLTAKDNEAFARSVANRYVGYLLGRGLVEPIDDMRSTNPPTNPALLDALAKDFAGSAFDLKQLIRTIVSSRLYQLDSQATAANASDNRFYSHFAVKRLGAEALLDAVDRVTGSPTKFPNLPLGTLAIELPDAEYPNYFLQTFAKPRRVSVCECERSPDESLTQALHTLNGDILATKISDKNGRLSKLLAANTPHEQIVEEFYLATLGRTPTEAERTASREFLSQSPSPTECYEDLLWALVNSKHFLFVR